MSWTMSICALALMLSLVAFFGELPASQWLKTYVVGGRRVSPEMVKVSAPPRSLMAMPGMASEDTSIDFAGLWHIAYTEWHSDQNGEWGHRHVMTRPGWQKTTKCFGNSSMECEECSGAFDCWTGSTDGSRLVQLASAAQDSVRYVSAIHVRCSSPNLHLDYEVQDLMYGHLRILWDGVEIDQHAANESSGLSLPLRDSSGTFQQEYSPNARSGSIDISTERLGAHVLEMEFTPFSSQSRVQISHLQVSMPKAYADCADYKTCLDPISTSADFRNNNSEQLKCLKATIPFSVSEGCARWRACLTEELQDQLRIMLVAAGVGGYYLNTSSVQLNVSNIGSLPTSGQEDGPECINPLVQDAESWTCDCFDEMKEACRAVGAHDELCMRAQFCEHPRVCNSWKSQACDEPEIQAMHTLLSGTTSGARRALLSRREGGDDEEIFDRSLGDKSCV